MLNGSSAGGDIFGGSRKFRRWNLPGGSKHGGGVSCFSPVPVSLCYLSAVRQVIPLLCNHATEVFPGPMELESTDVGSETMSQNRCLSVFAQVFGHSDVKDIAVMPTVVLSVHGSLGQNV